MKPLFTFLLFAAAASLVSCGAKSDAGATAQQAPARKPLFERVNEQNGYKQDAEGNWEPRTDKRSPYESQGPATYFQKDFDKKAYRTGDYAKTSFWGNKSYDRKAYAGHTDGSRFQTKSDLQDKTPRETTKRPDLPGSYDTGNYATGEAREAATDPVVKKSNDAIENRRKVFQQPEIIDWKEQRALTLEQSKGLLGN